MITGCSSGFSASRSPAISWPATGRSSRRCVRRASVLPPSPNLRVLALDVTNPTASARRSTPPARSTCSSTMRFRCGRTGRTDADRHRARALFETNTIGTIAVTRPLPQLRQRGAGVVVNVTSSVTLKVLPLLAAYRASKAAVNAYTESVALELAPFGVRAICAAGPCARTRFADNARAHMHGFEHEAYAELPRRSLRASSTKPRRSPRAGRRRSRVARGDRFVGRCAFRPAPMPSRGRRKRAEARRHGTNRLAGKRIRQARCASEAGYLRLETSRRRGGRHVRMHHGRRRSVRFCLSRSA